MKITIVIMLPLFILVQDPFFKVIGCRMHVKLPPAILWGVFGPRVEKHYIIKLGKTSKNSIYGTNSYMFLRSMNQMK